MLGKVIFYVIKISDVLFKMMDKVKTFGSGLKDKFNKLMLLPGFSHLGRLCSLILYPFIEIKESFLALI